MTAASACDKVAGAPVAQSEELPPFKRQVPRSKLGGGTTFSPEQLPANIQAKIRLEPCPVAGLPGPCWIWTGGTNSTGYGPHRRIYERVVGAVPDGLELDHLCEVKPCCNPPHLEPVTGAENRRRARIAAERRYDAWLEAHPWEPTVRSAS